MATKTNKYMENRIITIENGVVSVPANIEIWMTQYEIADLLQCFVSKINANVRSILKNGVLDETKVCRTYNYKNDNFVEQYSLEMIIALSFRIRYYNSDAFRELIVRKATAETSARQILIDSNWNQNAILNGEAFKGVEFDPLKTQEIQRISIISTNFAESNCTEIGTIKNRIDYG